MPGCNGQSAGDIVHQDEVDASREERVDFLALGGIFALGSIFALGGVFGIGCAEEIDAQPSVMSSLYLEFGGCAAQVVELHELGSRFHRMCDVVEP